MSKKRKRANRKRRSSTATTSARDGSTEGEAVRAESPKKERAEPIAEPGVAQVEPIADAGTTGGGRVKRHPWGLGLAIAAFCLWTAYLLWLAIQLSQS